MTLIDIVKQHAKKLGTAGVSWLEERERDQARLDYLDKNYTRAQDVYGRMANEEGSTVRSAIDFFMKIDAAKDVPTGG